MTQADYADRIFRTIANSAGGNVGLDTTFHYQRWGDVVWATYRGGAVAFGTLVGMVRADGRLDMRYQHVTVDREFKAGRCLSTPHVSADGRMRLDEAWTWTEGGTGSGVSQIEEIDPACGGDHRRQQVISRGNAEHYTWGGACDGWRLVERPGLSAIQERMPPGSAERLHVHHQARQLFYVLDGTLSIDIGDEAFQLAAGDSLEIAPGAAHRVRNTATSDASFLVVSSPSTQHDRTNLD